MPVLLHHFGTRCDLHKLASSDQNRYPNVRGPTWIYRWGMLIFGERDQVWYPSVHDQILYIYSKAMVSNGKIFTNGVFFPHLFELTRGHTSQTKSIIVLACSKRPVPNSYWILPLVLLTSSGQGRKMGISNCIIAYHPWTYIHNIYILCIWWWYMETFLNMIIQYTHGWSSIMYLNLLDQVRLNIVRTCCNLLVLAKAVQTLLFSWFWL
jgi:hypothetical protein